MEQKTILTVSSLSIERGDTRILRNINWKIHKDEQWAILGPNGCGKTSLLSAITGYLVPSAGNICLRGECYGAADWNEVRKQMGIVSNALTRRVPADEAAIETVLSGAEAQLGYWTRQKTVDTDKALRCLGKLGIRKLADRYWGLLSQGERQKVLIARALMADPKVMILDEPCAGLDPVARERFLKRVAKLMTAKKPLPMILVTHHLEEIIPEITHVLLMRRGRVMAAGRKSAILTSANMSTAFGASLRVRRNAAKDRWRLYP